jgi:tripartite-type tricarboxylate transporter receptor subunit TctC
VRGGADARAVARVARASPDGSKFYATTPTYIQTTLLSRPEFGYDALDPLAIVFLDPQVIYTRVKSPFRTLTEAVAHAKANPGRQKWGAASPASLERIALERISRLTGAIALYAGARPSLGLAAFAAGVGALFWFGFVRVMGIPFPAGTLFGGL